MEDNLVVLFCIVDEFCKEFYPEYEKTLITQGIKKRRRPSRIAPSEIITLFIYFHMNRVFRGIAKKSKSTIGWFFGFKLHLVINDKGELMAFKITAGNEDDRKPVPDLVKHLVGKIFGDKGYISQGLFEKLFTNGLQLITRLKGNMKNKLMPLIDKLLLRKRSLIETVNDQLKNISQLNIHDIAAYGILWSIFLGHWQHMLYNQKSHHT